MDSYFNGVNREAKSRTIMGEYECWDCNDKFYLEEPPYDGREICDKCREEYKDE
jgi:Zn finger protein HypA/HybF involved in hydrogenase expression